MRKHENVALEKNRRFYQLCFRYYCLSSLFHQYSFIISTKQWRITHVGQIIKVGDVVGHGRPWRYLLPLNFCFRLLFWDYRLSLFFLVSLAFVTILTHGTLWVLFAGQFSSHVGFPYFVLVSTRCFISYADN